jgi:hypothetical protein
MKIATVKFTEIPRRADFNNGPTFDDISREMRLTDFKEKDKGGRGERRSQVSP